MLRIDLIMVMVWKLSYFSSVFIHSTGYGQQKKWILDKGHLHQICKVQSSGKTLTIINFIVPLNCQKHYRYNGIKLVNMYRSKHQERQSYEILKTSIMFYNSPSISNIATYILVQLQQVTAQTDNSKGCYSNGNYISCNATDLPCAK